MRFKYHKSDRKVAAITAFLDNTGPYRKQPSRIQRRDFAISRTMLAKHFKIELHECSSTAVNDVQAVHHALNLVADVLGVTVIKTAHHQFVPHGITCLFLVSSSHFALHSWPEHKFVMVDIFICGDQVPINECVEQLSKIFEPSRTEFSILECGKEY